MKIIRKAKDFLKIFKFFFMTQHLLRLCLILLQLLTSSTAAGARHSSSKLGSALAVAAVAVLQFPNKL